MLRKLLSDLLNHRDLLRCVRGYRAFPMLALTVEAVCAALQWLHPRARTMMIDEALRLVVSTGSCSPPRSAVPSLVYEMDVFCERHLHVGLVRAPHFLKEPMHLGVVAGHFRDSSEKPTTTPRT